MPRLSDPRKFVTLLLAMLLLLCPPILRADSPILSKEAQAKLAPEYARLAEIEMSAEDAEKQAQAVESIVRIAGDDIAVQTTREVTAIYLPKFETASRDTKALATLRAAAPWACVVVIGGLAASFAWGISVGAK